MVVDCRQMPRKPAFRSAFPLRKICLCENRASHPHQGTERTYIRQYYGWEQFMYHCIISIPNRYAGVRHISGSTASRNTFQTVSEYPFLPIAPREGDFGAHRQPFIVWEEWTHIMGPKYPPHDTFHRCAHFCFTVFHGRGLEAPASIWNPNIG